MEHISLSFWLLWAHWAPARYLFENAWGNPEVIQEGGGGNDEESKENKIVTKSTGSTVEQR